MFNAKYIVCAILLQGNAYFIMQEVVVRNDSSCGSTIGPMMSANLAIKTADIGGPQLSMHSIREMCCTSGVYQSTALFQVLSSAMYVPMHNY